MKVDHASIMILKILKNIYHSFYHEKIWKDYYKMRAQFSFLNDEAPSKGEEKNVFYRSHENGKREILLEKISPFYLCCLQDMSLTIYKHFKTMLMFIVSYITKHSMKVDVLKIRLLPNGIGYVLLLCPILKKQALVVSF